MNVQYFTHIFIITFVEVFLFRLVFFLLYWVVSFTSHSFLHVLISEWGMYREHTSLLLVLILREC